MAIGIIGVLNACVVGPAGNDESVPRSLVEQTWTEADCVLIVDVLENSRFGHVVGEPDNGGYARYLVNASVAEVLEAVIPLPGNTIQYRFTEEVDSTRPPYVKAGRKYLVFLKQNAAGELWPVAEAAQFEMTPQLDRMVREIAVERGKGV